MFAVHTHIQGTAVTVTTAQTTHGKVICTKQGCCHLGHVQGIQGEEKGREKIKVKWKGE